MKTKDEVARAHDVLAGILLERLPLVLSNPENKAAMMAAADVLCWVLEHEDNQVFQDNLDRFTQALAAKGYTVERLSPNGHARGG